MSFWNQTSKQLEMNFHNTFQNENYMPKGAPFLQDFLRIVPKIWGRGGWNNPKFPKWPVNICKKMSEFPKGGSCLSITSAPLKCLFFSLCSLNPAESWWKSPYLDFEVLLNTVNVFALRNKKLNFIQISFWSLHADRIWLTSTRAEWAVW